MKKKNKGGGAKPLTPEQKDERRKKIVSFIIEHTSERGYPPSMREIGIHIGLTSSSTIWKIMHECAEMELIRLDSRVFRGVQVLPDGRKLVAP